MEMNKPIIAPSVLSANFANLEADLEMLNNSVAEFIHIDVMDGHYVANLAFSPKNVSDLRALTALPLHVHLEVDNPDQCLALFPDAHMIIVQEDTCPDLRATIAQIRARGIEVGVGINPDRPVARMLPYFNELDLLLVMAVWPGFGGQPFDARVLAKAEWARQQRQALGLNFVIGLDGGVSEATAPAIVQAGVEVLIAGSSIFGAVSGIDAVQIGDRVGRLRAVARLSATTH